MSKGYVSSIETSGFVDGPGVRFVVFFQGCNLRCLFCHNPETWQKNKGKKISAKTLLKEILKYKNYFNNNGGVTFSGGEPLLQDKFLLKILKLCKKNNIHTAIDTAGVGNGKYKKILKYTDLVILDIKAINNDEYIKMTGTTMDKFNEFLNECIKQNKKMWIRQVIVPTINDTKEYALEFRKFISNIKNVEKIEFLPYQTLGIQKYTDLKIKYRLEGIPQMDIKKCKDLELIVTKASSQ